MTERNITNRFRRQDHCGKIEKWPKLRTYLDNMRKSKSGTIISAPDLDFWTHLNVLLSLVWPRIQFRKINSSLSSDSIFYSVFRETESHNLSNWQTQILRYDNRRPLLLKTSFWIVTSKAEYKIKRKSKCRKCLFFEVLQPKWVKLDEKQPQ